MHVNSHGAGIFAIEIFLNDNFEGGNTDFVWESVKPSQGSALVFPHRFHHQGSVVTSGVKYILRTDVLYTKNQPVAQ
jgi:hypothetical protein